MSGRPFTAVVRSYIYICTFTLSRAFRPPFGRRVERPVTSRSAYMVVGAFLATPCTLFSATTSVCCNFCYRSSAPILRVRHPLSLHIFFLQQQPTSLPAGPFGFRHVPAVSFALRKSTAVDPCCSNLCRPSDHVPSCS